MINAIIAPGSSGTSTTPDNGLCPPGYYLTYGQRGHYVINADGTITVFGDGQAENLHFTYTVSDGLGHTDTGLVTINSVPCFVAGTLIRTPLGEVPVEELRPGDLVDTLDDGPQPLRWIGSRTVPAAGPLAPVCIKAGAFGDHRGILVSPQHRILMCDSLAELMFGSSEVLVAAQDLVYDHSVRLVPGGEVDYVHLLFDRHQILVAEGLASESFRPGPQVLGDFPQEHLGRTDRAFPRALPPDGRGLWPACPPQP